MKIYSWVGVLVVTTFTSQLAFSWGPEGHQTTALVAQQILQSQSQNDPAAAKALATVKAILGSKTIDQAATWPDEVKEQSRSCSDKDGPFVKDPTFPQTIDGKTVVGKSSAICEAYKATAEWHFATINADKGQTQYSFPSKTSSIAKKPSPYSVGDLVIIIEGLTHVLRSEPAPILDGVDSFATWKEQCLKSSGDNCKKEALEFLIHFLGDIHQPLHSCASCDVGGNSQYIVFFNQATDPAATWCKGKPASCANHELHQAWDTSMLVKSAATVVNGKVQVPSNFSADYSARLFRVMAQDQNSSQLCMKVAPGALLGEINIYDTGGRNNGPINWVNESSCYFKQVYDFLDDPQNRVAAKNVKSVKRSVAQAASSIPNLCDPSRKEGAGFDTAYKAFTVDQKYYNKNMVTIDERLYWGGSRLASLLNIYLW